MLVRQPACQPLISNVVHCKILWFKKTGADAIMDRIVHQSQRIELKGESLRRKWNKKPSKLSF